MNAEYARVHILDAPYHADKPYDYFLPPDIRGRIKVGGFVTVPFGKGNRKRIGIVLELCDKCEYDEVKPVVSVACEGCSLDAEMLGLCFYIKEQTLCTVGDAVHAMIPAAAFSKRIEYYAVSKDAGAVNPKNPFLSEVYEYLERNGNVTSARLKEEFGENAAAAAKALVRSGAAIRDFEVRESTSARYINSYSLAIGESEARGLLDGENGKRMRSERRRSVIAALLARSPLTDEELFSQSGATKAQIKPLLDEGFVRAEKIDVYRDPYAGGETRDYGENILSEEQNEAFLRLRGLYKSGEPKAALLYGVTGSGKTRVIKAIIDEALSDGRGAILLLPEIALTPQMIDLFRSYYGERVAVIHSALSAGERLDAYRRIRDGGADVVVGTRSAVFSPLKRIGVIIIDEEQEHTYKSESDPKYHARDVARYRCARHNALMVLSSATPSLESYYKAKNGQYELICLTHRYGEAKLPSVRVADMRNEAAGGNLSPIGDVLRKALAETVKNGDQAVLFLNRRGYNNFVSCRTCGEAIKCPHCSVALTYHTYAGGDGVLVCHYCGYRTPLPRVCPSCGGEHLSRMGYGTQRVEEELADTIPGAKVLRMDTDTTGSKFSYDRMLGAFRAHEANILLGTQMVTKGHDFPDVTLVGVLLADASLYLDDYRAGERTFDLITQVVGRAGRADKPGLAIIQTQNPDSDIIKSACAQDYEGFYAREAELRRLLVFPPFCDIALMTVSGADERETVTAASRLADMFFALVRGEYSDVPTAAFGPFEAPVYRVNGRYRMRMVIKCRLNRRSRALFSRVYVDFASSAGRKLTFSVDFNPSSL